MLTSRLSKLSRRCCLAAAFTLLATSANSFAQDATQRPIKLIVPGPGGSAIDIVARASAIRIGELLGQPIIIDNRTGAGGIVGAKAAAVSRPDGFTLFLGTAGTHGINSSLYKSLPYDPLKDFEPIAGLASSTNVLVVNTNSPYKSLSDLIAEAKRQPRVMTMGSGGNGTTPHLAGAMLNRMAGIETLHVPFSLGAILEVMAGRIVYSFESISSALPFIQAGQVRALAVTSPARMPQLKDVPTIAESGYPGYEVTAWVALFAPAGTPDPIVQRINEATNKALNDSAFADRLRELAFLPIGGTTSDLKARVIAEIGLWPPIVKESGAKND